MLKRLVSFLVISAIVFLSFGQMVCAESTNIKAELNSATVVLNGKALDAGTLFYDGRVYTSLRDLSKYFGSDLQVDDKSKTINLITGKAVVNAELSGKVLPKTTQSVNADVGTYKIKADGIDTYLNSIMYAGATYVPVRYLAEIFNKKIDWNDKNRTVDISEIAQNIIGTVNGENIMQVDFDLLYKPNLDKLKTDAQSQPGVNMQEQEDSLKTQVFDYIVARKLLEQKAVKNNVTLKEQDIQQINDTIAQMVSSNGGIDEFRKTVGKFDLYFHQVVMSFKESALLSLIQAKLLDGVGATEEQMKQYYDTNKSTFAEPDLVRAKHILIMTTDAQGQPLDAAKQDAAKKKAEDILSKIKAGGDFDKLMNENSEDPGLQQSPDGYTFAAGEMVKEFETAAFAMKVGEISGLVKTQYGYHIIKLEEKIPAKQLTYEESKEEIKAKLDPEQKQTYYDNLLKQWKSESKIENRLK